VRRWWTGCCGGGRSFVLIASRDSDADAVFRGLAGDMDQRTALAAALVEHLDRLGGPLYHHVDVRMFKVLPRLVRELQ